MSRYKEKEKANLIAVSSLEQVGIGCLRAKGSSAVCRSLGICGLHVDG